MTTALRERRIFTVRNYHKMIKAGIFVSASADEIIEGKIVKRNECNFHIACVNRLNMLFVQRLADQIIINIQKKHEAVSLRLLPQIKLKVSEVIG